MQSGRIAVLTLAAASALALGAPAAMASVDPNPAMPGQALTISDDKHCDMANGAKASSTLFGDAIMSAGANHMFVTVKVPSGTRSGDYNVTIECGVGGKTYNVTVHVMGVSVGTNTSAPNASAAPGLPGQSGKPTAPTKGAKTGLGGSIGVMNTIEVVGGAALLVVAGTAAVTIKRRRAGGKH
ncbi:hypothetical protein NGB36_05285 [Streptomyces sp. RB6PN25]|uniref:Lipoprotein n=1 Tax=Streptomyces humicola TaxID=2953240 RepID=A0ABT1PSV4_9ACTN|nr:hypothetical protein [Streptomyces humicola]MCQ4080020.1 hypothetical protein [Streptomyces humicola]